MTESKLRAIASLQFENSTPKPLHHYEFSFICLSLIVYYNIYVSYQTYQTSFPPAGRRHEQFWELDRFFHLRQNNWW